MDLLLPQNISQEDLLSCNFLVNFKCSVCADIVNKFVSDIGQSFPPVDNHKLKLLCTIVVAEDLPIDLSSVNGMKGDIRLCPQCDAKMDRLVVMEEELEKLWGYLQTKLRSRCKQMLGPDAVPTASPSLAARTNYFEFSTDSSDNQMNKFTADMEDFSEPKEIHCDSCVEVFEEIQPHGVGNDDNFITSTFVINNSNNVNNNNNNNLKINEHLTRSTQESEIDISELGNDVCENDTEDEDAISEEDLDKTVDVVKIEEAVTRMEEEQEIMVTIEEEDVKIEGNVKMEEDEVGVGTKEEMIELVTESGTQMVTVEQTTAELDGEVEKSDVETIVLKETEIFGTYGIVEGIIDENTEICQEEAMNLVKLEAGDDLMNEATFSVITGTDLTPDTTYVFLPSLNGGHGVLVTYPDEGLSNFVHSDTTLNISTECLMTNSVHDTIAVPMVSDPNSVFQPPQFKEETTTFTLQPQATSIYQFPATTEISGVKRLKEENYRLVDPKLMFTTNDTFQSLSQPQYITGSWMTTNIIAPANENLHKSRRKMKRKQSIKSLNDIIYKLSVDNKMKCPECHKRFSDQCQLERHVKVHKNGSSLQDVKEVTANDLCNGSITVLCSTTSADEIQLSADTAAGQSFSCCGITFNNEFEMSLHLKNHDSDKGGEGKISNCPSCNQSFDNQLELRLHNCTQYPRRSYMCSICGLLLPSLNCFNLHRKLHHDHN